VSPAPLSPAPVASAGGVDALLQVARFRAFAEHVVASLAPADATCDPAELGRRRAFVLSHLALGALPFAALPLLLASGQPPSIPTLASFSVPTASIVAALDVARSGSLDRAHHIVAASFVALVALVALGSGGPASPAIALAGLPVIDAALSRSRRGVGGAMLAAASLAVGLVAMAAAGAVPTGPVDPTLAAVAGVAGAVYAAALAMRAFAAAGAAEQASRPDVARFEVFAGSLEDVVTRHAPDGAATFASQTARRMLDAGSRDLLGQGLFSRVHIEDRAAYLQTLAAAASSDAPLRRELRLRRGAGQGTDAFVWVEMRARAVRPHEADEASAAAAPVVAMFRDVGPAKAHEEALIAAREEAERASLAKTRFLAHMSHELRTPLNAIIGFSEILSDQRLRGLTPERCADYAALIHRSGAHLLEVVDSILDVAKIESGAFAISPRPCDLEPLARQCLGLLTLKAETAGVTLAVAAGPDLPQIQADPRAMTQVLLNLVGNAVKFTPRGGEVSVALAPRPGGIAMSVRDTGVGIAPEHLGRLGEAFYQAESGLRGRHEGAGLGLSVVRGLVALHGGKIAVESALGRGTTVHVFLPASAAAATPIPPANPAAPAPIVEPIPEKVRLSA
jgi:cell cycle sensor histidine kinase DivJ